MYLNKQEQNIMIEETKLRQHIGKNEPFKVPEGYFDSFADRLQSRIEQLPQTKKPVTKRAFLVPRTWFAAAASIAIVASVGLSLMLPSWNQGESGLDSLTQSHQMASVEEFYDNSSMDESYMAELEYAMIDDNEIAYYLTEY